MNTTWSEASTWNSLSNGVSLNGTEAGSSALDTAGVTSTGWKNFDVTSSLSAWSGGTTNNGWVIQQTNSDAGSFATSEYGTPSLRPVLSITYTGSKRPTLDLDANNSSGSSGNNFNLSFTEGGSAVAIADSDASLTDLDGSLTGLTVSLSSIPDGAAEVLAATTTGTSISASYDSSTGVLTLSGTDTVANYQQVLRTITYINTSENPTAGTRTIAFVATDGEFVSAAASTTVTVVAVNDAPTELRALPGLSSTAILADFEFNTQNALNYDSSGDGQTLTLYGSPTYTTAGSSGALSFDGTQYATMPGFTTGANMTFAGRVRFDATAIGSAFLISDRPPAPALAIFMSVRSAIRTTSRSQSKATTAPLSPLTAQRLRMRSPTGPG